MVSVEMYKRGGHIKSQGKYIRYLRLLKLRFFLEGGLTKLPMWHSDQKKRKVTGGKRKAYRSNRSIEVGGYPTETSLGEPIRRVKKTYGSVKKIKLLQDKYVNISISRTGKTKKVTLDEVVENTANIDYNRRRVITKGTVIETALGRAVITSRPGQDGVLNAILLTDQ